SAPQAVTLSDSGPPLTISGITITGANASDFRQTNTCPASLAGGTSCQVQVTFRPSMAGAESATLTVIDDSGGVQGSTQTAVLSGTGQDFTVSAYGTATSVAAGGTATDALQVSPAGGFNGTVSLTCSGAPSKSTCSVMPSSLTLDGVNSVTPMLRVTTTAHSNMVPLAPDPPSVPPGVPWLGLMALIGLAALARMRRFVPRAARMGFPLTFLLALVLGVVCVSCAGGGGGSTGTPAGTYMLTVTAASGNASHQVTVTLTVR
ncbi:MAG: choice-of-anchor D domain-containing protein, partial [Candidatus Acidiferrum sp.]